jgi:hypothetical protein
MCLFVACLMYPASNSTKFVPLSRWWRIPNSLHTYRLAFGEACSETLMFKVVFVPSTFLCRARFCAEHVFVFVVFFDVSDCRGEQITGNYNIHILMNTY